MIKVLLADNHAILREGLRGLLSIHPEIEVVAEAADGKEAVALASQVKPDVVLMDISMPVLNGMEAAKAIKQAHPDMKILMLTRYESEEYLFKVLQLGTSGYVLKSSASTELIWAIKTASEGLTYLSPAMTRFLLQKHFGKDSGARKAGGLFTQREEEVLKLIAEGHTNQEVADKLFISLKTVQSHRTHVMEKLNLHDRTELVKYAIAEGIISV